MKLKTNNKNKKNIRNYLFSGNLTKITKLWSRLLILFIIVLFSIVSYLKFPMNFNNQSEELLITVDNDLKLNNGGDKFFKFEMGTEGFPSYILTMDPHNVWDKQSIDVIDQVCEGLYKYDLSDPNHAIIPNLAVDNGSWSLDGLNYTIPLRSDVTFHDGTPFNAIAVNFSFSRLQYFINASGDLPSGKNLAIMDSLYKFLNGTPIINRTEIINNTSVKFVLNAPYAPFQALLSYESSYILSPTSTPAIDYIDLNSGDLVGTGPFVYDEYTPDIEVRFHAFENYWNGKADIELLIFKIMGYERNDAILDGTIDYLLDYDSSRLPEFNANPYVKVVDVGPSLAFYYLSMNNKQINKTFRQAISYAVNYSDIIDNLYGGNAVRAGSPVPPGMKFSNWTNNYATLNITKAREIMQSMGFGVTWDTSYPGINEADWTSADFKTFNYSYNSENIFRSNLYPLLSNCLDRIGIDVLNGSTSYDWFIQRVIGNVPGGYDDLQLFWMGWGADFNDPSSMINSLFSNISTANNAQVNDSYLQNLMDQGLSEADPNVRKAIYDEIQRYLVEDLMPVVFCLVPRRYDVYCNYILGYQSNSWGKVWFHGVSRDILLPHKRIHIIGNQEWNYLKNAEKCTGYGSYLFPYIIDDLIIDGRNYGSGILIENSSVYFKIENCRVYSSGGSSLDAGIKLYSAGNGTLINNDASNNNNFGIFLYYSDNNTVSGNIANNNQYGIVLRYSNNTIVFGNSFNHNSIDWYLQENCINNFFSWNLRNGVADPITIDDSGGGYWIWTQAANLLAWITGTGTSNDPYTIDNIIIDAQNSGSCIKIKDSDEYVIISNSYFSNSGSGTTDAGINLEDVKNVQLNYVDCSNNNGYGIYLSNCQDVYITESTIDNNAIHGIALYNSHHNYIRNNDDTINHNIDTGIFLNSSDNNEISQNIINYNDYGIYLLDSSYNTITDNDWQYNNVAVYESPGCEGNTFSGNYPPIGGGQFPFWIIILAIASIIAVIAIGGLIVWKKRTAIPKIEKEEKKREKERLREEKEEQKIEERERKIEKDLQKRISFVDNLIKENKLEMAIKNLAEIQEQAQTHKFIDIANKTKERINLCKKLEAGRKEQERLEEEDRLEKERQKIEEDLQKRISSVDDLIDENKLEIAIKNLVEIQKEAQAQELIDIVNKAEEKIVLCKKSELETVNRIKQTILTLGAKFTRLQLVDISEKSGIEDVNLIESVIQNMIRNKEIHGEYFSSSKALALETAALIPAEEKVAEYNVFISYSTLDTDYLQVSKIVRRLELYPEINEVLFWEADSQQNIVEFMEETLRKTTAFILFCSENSIKSEAVKGEWQSAYQMVKKGLMKIIPVYEDEDHIPRLLWQMLNVKFTKDDFEGFIQKLYDEIIR